AHRASRPPTGPALRRPAPAGGHGPGHRPRRRRLPLRRAVVQPRRPAALPDADGDLPAPAEARSHHRVRHPRPGARYDAGRPARERGVTFEVTVEIVEWLGSEQSAYVPFQAPPEMVEPLQQLVVELDREAPRTQLVASIDPASRIRPGDRARLWFDPANLHLF